MFSLVYCGVSYDNSRFLGYLQLKSVVKWKFVGLQWLCTLTGFL
jgi:hypothetical protein